MKNISNWTWLILAFALVGVVILTSQCAVSITELNTQKMTVCVQEHGQWVEFSRGGGACLAPTP